jgi:hypothetical protein
VLLEDAADEVAAATPLFRCCDINAVEEILGDVEARVRHLAPPPDGERPQAPLMHQRRREAAGPKVRKELAPPLHVADLSLAHRGRHLIIILESPSVLPSIASFVDYKIV